MAVALDRTFESSQQVLPGSVSLDESIRSDFPHREPVPIPGHGGGPSRVLVLLASKDATGVPQCTGAPRAEQPEVSGRG